MPVALFLSPHLDDVVFSCGGLAARLADQGWHTALVTAFTRSVVPASGFALACQLDKGLSPEVDYLALRRAEDREAAAILGFQEVRWLDLPEAPHRGYETPQALFGEINEADAVAVELTAMVMALVAELRPDLVLAPQGLGNHVDHQQVIAAVQRSVDPTLTAYYRDTPYALRQPAAIPVAGVPCALASTVPIGAAIDRKIMASQAYASQIGFQFGGADPLSRALRDFARREGGGIPAERFCGRPLGELLHSIAA